MAEALTRHLTHDQVEVFSAGNQPASQIHPAAGTAIAKVGADMRKHVPKHLTQFQGQHFDRVVILRARDEEEGPSFSGSSQKIIAWDFADPVRRAGTPEEQARVFNALVAELMVRIRLMLTMIEVERRERG